MTLPMGVLSQPLNTFWQLFFEPRGKSTWTDEVEATAVATNGGIVVTSSGNGSVIVGVRPSRRLTFSPLISTSNSGRSWSNGVLGEGLAALPDALASSTRGETLALVAEHGTTKVVASGAGLDSWRTLATEATLAAGPGRGCGLESLEAIAFLAGRPLVGGSCARPGVVGLFLQTANGWRQLGLASAASTGASSIGILGLQAFGDGLSVVLALSRGTQTRMLTTWSADGGRHWSSSGTLSLAQSEHVRSFGQANRGQTFLLLAGPGGAARLEVGSPGRAWQELPSPPAGTATVAVEPNGSFQALAANGSTLTVWSLSAGASSWSQTQQSVVPIQYGSSG